MKLTQKHFHTIMATMAFIAIVIGLGGLYISYQNYRKLDRNFEVVKQVEKNGKH